MPEKIRPIGRGSRKPVGAIAVLAALIVAMAMLLAARTAMVLGQPPAPDAAIAPPDLRMAEGMVSGGFNNRPLFEILHALRSHANFEYEGDESSLNHPVSGMFDRVPLREAVKQVLEPTNYTMVFDATGMLRSLRIGSLRRRPEGWTPASVTSFRPSAPRRMATSPPPRTTFGRPSWSTPSGKT